MKLEDKLLDRVDILSEKLNGLGTHAWDSLIKYEIITGIAQLVGAFLILLFILFLSRVFYSIYNIQTIMHILFFCLKINKIAP